MTNGELLKMLTNHAKDYRDIASNSISRNKNMNKLDGALIHDDIIDAVLVDFINYIAAEHGGNYGLCTKHLKEKN